jgi:hypothetical protein
MGMKRRDEAERFWEKVERRGEDECWPWLAGTHKGYGTFREAGHRSNKRKAHAGQVAWRLANGPLPEGLEVDHLCRNRLCCNPQHLEAVTHSENMKRAWRRGTRTGYRYKDGTVRVFVHPPRL